MDVTIINCHEKEYKRKWNFGGDPSQYTEFQESKIITESNWSFSAPKLYVKTIPFTLTQDLRIQFLFYNPHP